MDRLMHAAIAKRLAHIAREPDGGDAWQALPAIGAALIRAGKTGATVRTLAAAANVRVTVAKQALQRLEAGGFAQVWGVDGTPAEVWRLDTVQILAREERAALEALKSAQGEETPAGKGNTPAGEESAANAQKLPAVCLNFWRRDNCTEQKRPCKEGRADEREAKRRKGVKNG